MLKRKLSFSIIEVIVVLMAIGVLSMGLFQGYQMYINDSIKYKLENKLRIVESQAKLSVNSNLMNLFNERNISVIDSAGNTIKIYDINISDKKNIQPIYNSTDPDVRKLQLDFWGVSRDLVTDFANKPMDININSAYTYNHTLIPYKNILIISWGRLNSFRDFVDENKTDFLFETSMGTRCLTYSELNATTKQKWGNWAAGLGKTANDLFSDIHCVQVSNIKEVRELVDKTVEKAIKIKTNMEYWVNSKIISEVSTGSNSLSKDYFVFAKYDVDAGSGPRIEKISFESEDLDSNSTYNSGTSFTLGKNYINTVNDDSSSGKTLDQLGKDNVFAIVNKGITDEKSFTFFRTTANSEYEINEDYYPNLTKINRINGFVTIIDNNETNVIFEQQNEDLNIYNKSRTIMGVSTYNDAAETIEGIPFLFSNALFPSITIEKSSGGDDTYIFKDIRKPIIEDSGGNFVDNSIHSPPYNSKILVIFPWIREAIDKNDLEKKFGYIDFNVYSISKYL